MLPLTLSVIARNEAADMGRGLDGVPFAAADRLNARRRLAGP